MGYLTKLVSEKLLFSALIICSLFTIWLPEFLVQGDGPAHIYNSKILLDIIRGCNTEFYSTYYNFSFEFVPNWFTHICLAAFQVLFAPVIAEKVYVSIYVILTAFSLRFLAQQFGVKSSMTYLLALPFMFHFLYYYGFYNYCFGLSFALLFVACWLKWQTENTYKRFSGLLLLSVLVFFTHPLGWFLIGVILPGFALVDLFELIQQNFEKTFLQKIFRRWLPVAVAAVVPFVLSLVFMQKHSADELPKRESISRLWQALTSLEVLNMYSRAEDFIAPALAILIICCVVFSVLYRIKNKLGLGRNDSLLLGTAILLIVYFVQPSGLTLASFWIHRMSWLPWLLLILWLSATHQPKWLTNIVGSAAAIVFVILLMVRLPFQLKNAEAEKDYLSAVKYIPSKSIVLPLSFCNFGCDDKGKVYNKNWFFQHAFDYSGAIKTNINLVNYQAQTPWFPVQYKHGCNPYELLNCTECQPPNVLLDGFINNGCSWKIEYVVTFCSRFRDSDNELTIRLNKQLAKDYVMIYESLSKRTQLWRHKSISN